jgi:hypothetical protein
VFSRGTAEVRDVVPTAHRHVSGVSFQAHRRFLPQLARQRHFIHIPFAQVRQVFFLSAWAGPKTIWHEWNATTK